MESGDDLDDGLGVVLEQEAQSEIEFASLEGPLFPQPSWRVGVLGAEGVDGEEVVPADGQTRQRQGVQLYLATSHALVALEALLLLPQHHQEVATQGVAAWVLQGLTELGVARVTNHARLALVQPALLGTKICLYVRVWKFKFYVLFI